MYLCRNPLFNLPKMDTKDGFLPKEKTVWNGRREAMIYKTGDRYILVCDICGIEDDETFYDFYDAVEHKKANGWKSQKYRGEWEDVCPECQQEG